MTTRIIKISKNKIYFTNDVHISLKQTNFPEDSITFKHHLDIYLEVELSNYDNNKKELEIKIIDYSPENVSSFNDQKLKKLINKLIFKELEWTKLQKLLSSFLVTLPNKIPDAFIKETKREKLDNTSQKTNLEKVEKPILNSNNEVNQDELEIITHKVSFEALFSDSQFHLGFISVIKKFHFAKHPIEFRIVNSLILSEYDYIKNYFSNYYRSDSFNVTAIIKTKGQDILNIDCQSKMIENINEKIIENVKIDRTLNLSKIETSPEKEKGTFTSDEMFSKLDDSNNIFNQNAIEILNTIIKSKSPRNAKQLMYLSGEKHDITKKIRFTLNPLFGFIFFISGDKRNHICWELLDSHATYLWSFDKELSIESQIQFSELNINTIRKIGRMKYRTLIKNKEININSVFNVINHSKSKNIDVFEIWRNKLIYKLM